MAHWYTVHTTDSLNYRGVATTAGGDLKMYIRGSYDGHDIILTLINKLVLADGDFDVTIDINQFTPYILGGKTYLEFEAYSHDAQYYIKLKHSNLTDLHYE